LAHRLPLALSRHATVPTVPRFHEDRQTTRPGNRKGHTMTEAGIARAMFRVAVSGRREQEASFFT
jgi:hypothetical protein